MPQMSVFYVKYILVSPLLQFSFAPIFFRTNLLNKNIESLQLP